MAPRAVEPATETRSCAAIGAADKMLSQEFLLTAACCRWPPSDERAAAVGAAAKRVTDWDRFLSVVKRHRVVMLVQAALRAATIEAPPVVAGEMNTLVQRHVRRGLRLAAETVRLQNLLTAAGIPNLALKGVALERLAYGSISAKQTRDIDLLVSPQCAQTALRIIEGEGYALALPAKNLNEMQRRALIRFGREVELVAPRTKVRVELQWRVADNPILLSGIDALAVTQTVKLSEDAKVCTLAPDDLFAYLCVHGAHHSWSRLKWLADFNALIAGGNADLAHLYRHAQKVGAGYCAGQALVLCERLLGLRLPTPLARDLQANKRCQNLAAIAMAAMMAPEAPTDRDRGVHGVMRELSNQFLLGQGFAFYLAQCRLAYAGAADIVRVPLPRALHFLYPLLRLPLWMWRRAKLAFAPL